MSLKKVLMGTIALGWGLFGQGSVQAHERDFPFTYDWAQPSKGEKEIESHTAYNTGSKSLEEELEFEYGVTDKFMIAPYIVYTKENGDHFRYAGYKVETRYQLGTRKTNTFLPGLYLEFEKPKGEPGEGELKLILSRYDSFGGDFSINLIGERAIEHDDTLRTAYSFGYARPVSMGKKTLRVGGEVIKDIDSGRVNGGPTLAFSPGSNTWVVAGIALPLNSTQSNRTDLRLLAEYEW